MLRATVRWKVLYFAYGSNLNAADLARWCAAHGHDCSGIRAIERAWMPDAELAFAYLSRTRGGGTLDVRSRRGSAVPGMLFDVDDAGWRALDAKEGAPDRYVRTERIVLSDRGEEIRAWTYVVAPRYREPRHVEPAPSYVSLVNEGLASYGLPIDHVRNGSWPRMLFVYGTLMRGEARHDLLSSCRYVRDASLPSARLISLGEYPGLLFDEGVVEGELFEIEEHTIAALDEYEGFAGYGVDRTLFRRVIVSAEGSIAWTYDYRGPMDRAIPIGNWRLR